MEEKQIKNKTFKNASGITLIALVVTIIVIIILALIGVRAAIGENGIIGIAKDSREQLKITEEKKIVEESSMMSSIKSKDGIITQEGLQKELDSHTGEGKTQIREGETDTLIVTFIESQRHYEVDIDDGKVKQIEKITTIEEAEIKVQCNPAGWTNQDVIMTITSNEKYSDFDVMIRKNTSEPWTKSTGTETVKTNQTIYIKLEKDKERTRIATVNIVNIDKLPPQSFTPTAGATTNTVTVKAITEDREATSEYGKSGIDKYRFSLDNGSTWTDWQDGTEYKFTGVKQSTLYNIVVQAKDHAGNITEGTTTATTSTVTALIRDSNVSFSANPSGWTNQNVTVTASTTVSEFTFQTSIDGMNWSSTAIQTRSTNGLVYARLWDGTNAGSYATCNITNIDKLPPQSFTPTVVPTTNSVTVKATTEDREATSEYGKSGIDKYRFSLDNGSTWTNWQDDKEYKFTGLKQSTLYKVVVQAKDRVGNMAEGTTTATTSTVTALIRDGNVSFSANPSGWTKQNVTVTASTTVPGFTLQTSVDGTNWSSTASQTRSTNGLVYARLTDGLNVGSSATCNVTNIDKIAPTISSYTSNSPQAVVTLSGTAQDKESGISAYMFSQNGSLNENSSGWQYITATTSSIILNQNVTTSGTWYFYVKDQAGNYSKSSINIQVQTTWSYGYSGGVQSWTAPYSGWFKLEVWGAQGGNSTLYGSTAAGGYGGYACGNTYVGQGSTLYITVGGMGASATDNSTSYVAGGYNGGGLGGWYSDSRWGGGGGATSITTTNRGVLSNFNSYRGEILIVAGGGGGAGRWSGDCNNGGAGGGTNGSNGAGPYYGDGASQSGGGAGWHYPNNPATKYVSSSFGQGQNSYDGSGGGGGYFGGGTGIGYGSGAGGGSGYTGGVSSASMSNGAQTGNGYARITWVSN